MSVEEFHLQPEHPGWKKEYWDGQTHLTPRFHAVVTTVKVQPREVKSPCKLRPARREDLPRLIPIYVAAFGQTIEYCDYSIPKVEESARRALKDHFAGRRGDPLPGVSQVAFDDSTDQEKLLGTALVGQTETGPLLDLLFVAPECHRQGIASALVSQVLNELHTAGETRLTSQYHIGNDESRLWHQRFGFIEEPDLKRARLYRMCARHELWRREQIGDLTSEEHARLKSECEFWEKQVEELERIEDEQGFEAVHPKVYW